jgi:hypothetical protein
MVFITKNNPQNDYPQTPSNDPHKGSRVVAHSTLKRGGLYIAPSMRVEGDDPKRGKNHIQPSNDL